MPNELFEETLSRVHAQKHPDWQLPKHEFLEAKKGLKPGEVKNFTDKYAIRLDPGSGVYTAVTASRSKGFKTYAGALKWLKRVSPDSVQPYLEATPVMGMREHNADYRKMAKSLDGCLSQMAELFKKVGGKSINKPNGPAQRKVASAYSDLMDVRDAIHNMQKGVKK